MARRRKPRFSLLSQCMIIGSAIGVLAGWLCAISLVVGFELASSMYDRYLQMSYPLVIMSLFGGAVGFVGLFCGLPAWVLIRLYRWLRRTKTPLAETAQLVSGP
jgi:predicted PurR-regulated permease PerM